MTSYMGKACNNSPAALALKCFSDLTSLDRTRYPSILHELANHSLSVNTVNVYANLKYVHGTKYLLACANFLYICSDVHTLCRYTRVRVCVSMQQIFAKLTQPKKSLNIKYNCNSKSHLCK